MAYVPSYEKALALDKALSDRESAPSYVPTYEHTLELDKRLRPVGHVQNFVAGLTHDPLSLLNLAATGAQALTQPLTHQPIDPHLIPQIPHTPHSWMYGAGNIAGYVPPFSLAAKGIEGGALGTAKLAELASRLPPGTISGVLSRIPGAQLAGRLAQSTGAGVLTGAATADPGERERSALWGGAGGLGGEVLGQAIARGMRPLRETAALKKLQDITREKLKFLTTPGERLLKAIGQAYINARNQTAPLFENIFGRLRENGVGMKRRDFKNYNRVRSSDIKENLKIPKDAIRVEDMLTKGEEIPNLYRHFFKALEDADIKIGKNEFPTYENLKAQDIAENRAPPFEARPLSELVPSEGGNPADVHSLMRDLRSLGGGRPRDPYTVYAQALQKDLGNFLGKYKGAGIDPQAMYKKIGEYENYADPLRAHRVQSLLNANGDKDAWKYGKALKKDLVTFLHTQGLGRDYENASALFKEHVAPFLNNKTVKSNIVPKVESEIYDIATDADPQVRAQGMDNKGKYIRQFTGINDIQGEASTIAKKLVPTKKGEQELSKLEYLEKILPPEANPMHHARDNMFVTTLERDPRDLSMKPNIAAVLNKYDDLDEPQIKKLFTPNEKAQLDTLLQAKSKIPKTHRLSGMAQRVGGALIGHHLGGVPGTFAGYLSGPAAHEALQGFAEATAPQDVKTLIQQIERRFPLKRSRVAAPLLSALMTKIGR